MSIQAESSVHITDLLKAFSNEDPDAMDRLMPVGHNELQRQAPRFLKKRTSKPYIPEHSARKRSILKADQGTSNQPAEPCPFLRTVGEDDEAHSRQLLTRKKSAEARRVKREHYAR